MWIGSGYVGSAIIPHFGSSASSLPSVHASFPNSNFETIVIIPESLENVVPFPQM